MPNTVLRSSLTSAHVRVPTLFHRNENMRRRLVPEDADPRGGLLLVAILEQVRRNRFD